VSAYRVAKDTGIANTLFSDWKSGKSKPKADKLKILADYFGVSIEYFLS
jgi:repressor LexA